MKSPKKPPRKPAKLTAPRRPTKGQVKRGNDWLKP
jgi:hypothetical protein